METTVTVPQINDNQQLEVIILTPGSFVVRGRVIKSTGEKEVVSVDITTEWAAAQQANKDVVKAFIKKLGALLLDKANENIGVDVTDADVTGEIWD